MCNMFNVEQFAGENHVVPSFMGMIRIMLYDGYSSSIHTHYKFAMFETFINFRD